jgi:FkbM family methyltransferase
VTLESLPVLSARLSTPLRVIDVGARWGIGAQWQIFGDVLEVYGFDPDPLECARLNASAPPNVKYVPLALGSSAGTATLHITREPACSSLYRPKPDLGARIPELACALPDRTETVLLHRLDDWKADNGVGPVSYLKLDTQGSELDILRGSVATLADAQLVEVEVSFNPIYENCPLFGDVDRFMRSQGFELWRFMNETHYSTDPAGFADLRSTDVQFFDSVPFPSVRGGGQIYWCNAFFARAELAPASTMRLETDQAIRAACVALACGFEDLARGALAKADLRTIK